MRHERIHAMHCACDRCAPRQPQPAIEPADIDAARKGLIFGLFVVGVMAARQYAPTIIDWVAS